MATPEFDNNFRLNMETVAAFAGLGSLPRYEEELEQTNVACETCGKEVSEVETSRNSGCCDYCAGYSEPT